MPCVIGVCLFQFYGYLSQQQNMMQDYVRTGTYQRAILQNHTDFKDKVTRAAGTGLLPCFCLSVSLVIFFFFFLVWGRVSRFWRQGFSMHFKLTLNSLCVPGWP